jgi:hypothetical protein
MRKARAIQFDPYQEENNSMTTQKNTPTPWKIAGGYHLLGADGKQIATFVKSDDWEKEQQANQALTLTAVNSHAELVEALKKARKRLNDFDGNIHQRIVIDDVKKILSDAIKAVSL